MNPVEIAALDALNLLVVVDNESDTLSSVDKGVPQLPELGRPVARVPRLAPKDGHDCVEPWGHLCLACHGFSALVTGGAAPKSARSSSTSDAPPRSGWRTRVGSASGSPPSKPCASRTGTRITAAGSRAWWPPSLGPASTKGSRRRSSIYTQTGPTSVAP